MAEKPFVNDCEMEEVFIKYCEDCEYETLDEDRLPCSKCSILFPKVGTDHWEAKDYYYM